MGHTVTLLIPDQGEDAIGPIIGRIIGRWGGCTISDGYGWWSDNDAEALRDKLSVVRTSIGPWTTQVREWWMDLADVVRVEWKQESVFLSVTAETAWIIGRDSREEIGYGT